MGAAPSRSPPTPPTWLQLYGYPDVCNVATSPSRDRIDSNQSCILHYLPLLQPSTTVSDTATIVQWRTPLATYRNTKWLNHADKWGQTPLHVAARQTNSMTLLFLEMKADINALNKEMDTPLMTLCRYGSADRLSDEHSVLVDALLKAGSDINETNTYGDSAFSLAASSGKAKVIALLLQRRVRVPKSLVGSFRTSVASVYALYIFFTTTAPSLMHGDLLIIICHYLLPDQLDTRVIVPTFLQPDRHGGRAHQTFEIKHRSTEPEWNEEEHYKAAADAKAAEDAEDAANAAAAALNDNDTDDDGHDTHYQQHDASSHPSSSSSSSSSSRVINGGGGTAPPGGAPLVPHHPPPPPASTPSLLLTDTDDLSIKPKRFHVMK